MYDWFPVILLEWTSTLEHVIFFLCISILVQKLATQGFPKTFAECLRALRAGVPGLRWVIEKLLRREVQQFVSGTINDNSPHAGRPPNGDDSVMVTIPEKGLSNDELEEELKSLKDRSVKNHRKGQIFAYVYTLENDMMFELQKKAYSMFTDTYGFNASQDEIIRTFQESFMHENALSPMVFPCLRKFETELVSMTAGMLNGDKSVVGSVTSGGTESILMAVKTYRDQARHIKPYIQRPEMVAPITIHPAFEKAAHYFGLRVVHVPLEADFTVNVKAIEQAITSNTILLACSAPQYCHGMVDPVEELSHLAIRRGLPLHVDACFGGYMLPWLEKLGYKIPLFDFRLLGVTFISADIHKYGYSTKGASVVLYRNSDIRKYQIFAYSQWPGGLFGSPSMAGTRPGGNLAAAWVTLKALGQNGYTSMAKRLMDATMTMKEGIRKISGLDILGDPIMTSFAIGSKANSVDLLVVADDMETKGWKIERQQSPTSIHCSVLPHHIGMEAKFVDDLKSSVEAVKGKKSLGKGGSAGMYGMVAKIPDKTIVDDFIVEFFNQVYR